ncbi:unnamed protein product [Discula destructiva]
MRLVVASSLTLGAALVAASPLLETRADTVTLTTEEYDNLKYYAQYSASAYCNSQDAVGSLVTCEGGCAEVMDNGATILGVMPNTTVFDLEGYVALDTVREEIVVAFRGSSDLRNWIADFDFILTPFSECDGCYVHNGFYESWQQIKSYAQEFVQGAYALHPDYKLTLTGHSLGAAVATVAAVDFRVNGYPCDVYTVGSPRVGNLEFAEFVTAQTGAEYRATHYDDPVPRLPPIVLGFYHTSPEYWLEAGPATNIDYTIDEIAICTGYANTTCNAGTSGLDANAHEYYFQYLSCDTGVSNGIDLRRDKLDSRQDTNSTDVSDEELAEKLSNYTMQDIAYSQQLADQGMAQWP